MVGSELEQTQIGGINLLTLFPRSCAFQENLEHAKAFNHLCERMSDDDFVASTQPTPTSDPVTSSNVGADSTLLLCRAIVDIGLAFDVSTAVISELSENCRIAELQSQTNGIHSIDRHFHSEGAADFPYHDEDDEELSDGSHDESEHSEGTPASTIYQERGVESRATQTDFFVSNEATANEGERTGLNDEEPATAVGRTVVDENGDPMRLDQNTVSAFINFVLQGDATRGCEDTNLNGNSVLDVIQAATASSDSPVGKRRPATGRSHDRIHIETGVRRRRPGCRERRIWIQRYR